MCSSWALLLWPLYLHHTGSWSTFLLPFLALQVLRPWGKPLHGGSSEILVLDISLSITGDAPSPRPREKGNAPLLLDEITDLNAQQLPLWLAKTCAHLLRGFVTGDKEFRQLQENSGFPPKYKFGEGKKKKDKDTKTQNCRLEHKVPVDTGEDALWLHVLLPTHFLSQHQPDSVLTN